MKIGIESFKEAVEVISYIITIISLLGLWIAYVQSRKQIHFSTMGKCINDYRNFLQLRNNGNLSGDDIAAQYIDLVNEEFFYLENGYLPIDVCIEWIDGIIDYLPFYYNNNFISSKNLVYFNNSEDTIQLLNDYPRLMKAIQITDTIDFKIVHDNVFAVDDRFKRRVERNKLIYNIINNLKNKRWNKRQLLSKINNR